MLIQGNYNNDNTILLTDFQKEFIVKLGLITKCLKHAL